MQLTEIRPAVNEADIDYGIELIRQCYPDRDIRRTRDWAMWLLKNPNRLVLIGSHSAGGAQFFWRYGFEPRARMDFLAATPAANAALEPLRMIRAMVEWAKLKGAKGAFILDADTGIDFGPFAKRLCGYERISRRWEIPLE